MKFAITLETDEDGYVVANARVSYMTGDGHWEAALFYRR